MGNSKSEQKLNEKSYFQELKENKKNDKVSNLPPFSEDEIVYLRNLFSKLDTKNTSTISLQQINQINFIFRSPFFNRIKTLIQQDFKKTKLKKLNFQMFVEIISVFHINTNIEDKYKYLFRIYDWDKDYKLNADDILKTLNTIHNKKNSKTNIYQLQDLKYLSQKYIEEHGEKGYIKIQVFRDLIKEEQVQFFLTVKFS